MLKIKSKEDCLIMNTTIRNVKLKTGITRTPEFEKKGLATHAVNVGLACGHRCTYCSTPTLVRRHPFFREIGSPAFTPGLVIVDPSTPDRIRKDVAKLTDANIVQLCTTTDAWSPEAQEFNLGRRCLQVLLEESLCNVRILTKNAAVARDFDLIAKYRTRVQVGLSITAPPSKSHIARVFEPGASSMEDRLEALSEAHRLGLRTFGMLCPCLPGVLNDAAGLSEIGEVLRECNVEEVFLEPVNARGPALGRTEEALRVEGADEVADAIRLIRVRKNWSAYTADLIKTSEKVFHDFSRKRCLHFLLYSKTLQIEDRERIDRYSSIVWL